MIEFLAEWLVTFLIPATHVLEVRTPHLSFMFVKEYWFRELYLGLKVTASFDRSESYTRVIDGQVRCITPEIKPQNLQVIWNVQFITVFVQRAAAFSRCGNVFFPLRQLFGLQSWTFSAAGFFPASAGFFLASDGFFPASDGFFPLPPKCIFSAAKVLLCCCKVLFLLL